MSEFGSMMNVRARPEALMIDPATTAVIVVDMQNDFAAPGGMFDRAGIPIDGIQAIVGPIGRTLDAARAAGMPIVFLKMQYAANLSDAGPSQGPNRLKHEPLRIGEPVDSPDGTPGAILVEDTWNTQIVPDLAPRTEDLVLPKGRYSGFFETDLDRLLREARIETLIFTGATTSVCVESTLRDAFFRDYRCLLLSDCTAEPIGGQSSPSNHDASLLVIEMLFGWVTDSASLLTALDVDHLADEPLQQA
jgi:ureidoacrylate peracid hydrolase